MLIIIMDVLVLVLLLLLPIRLTRIFLIRSTHSRFDPTDVALGGNEPFWFMAACAFWDMAATDQLWYLIHHKRDALICMVRNKRLSTNSAIWHCALISLISITFIDKSKKAGYEIGTRHSVRIAPLRVTVSIVFR